MGGGAQLRRMIRGKRTVVAPGVFSPAVALLAREEGFKALYFSGAGFSGLLGLPDLGVTTLSELSAAVRAVTDLVETPLIVDADTGFGEAVNVVRTMRELGSAGAAAVQIEDQVMPKKCGHLEGKEVVEEEEMVKKVMAAKSTGAEPLLVARTDARAVEGLDSAVERARLYERAGADIIFPEALRSKAEFAEFRKKVSSPLMANMTEFGKTPYVTAGEFGRMGYNIVIFPVTAFRAAMESAKGALAELKRKGTQKGMLGSLMPRQEFYRLIGYDEYARLDRETAARARRVRGA